ncbi:MAG: RecX family transcriptional regulator [Prevotella sp.]|jgi:regulatory protein|nr:regulatory protein RecX [Prevotella sp.]MBP8687022.1 RecX family transcriptional regulator [Prevotella sp.]MBP9982354.1 RecX family transcriptional regulator [Prevotella sp.]MCI1731309.1 RecX family transcriptional regulator [Prevotella sp.]
MKQISEKEAQLKLSSLCAQGEHCTQELIDKLNKWEIPEDAQARIMEYLTKNKFVDDARFCVAFVKDKIKYNGWGRKKVEQALYIKRIPRSMSDPVFEEIPDEMYLEKLRPLIKQKYPTIKARNEYERAMKLIKFAMGRGFDMRIIRMCIDEAEELADD